MIKIGILDIQGSVEEHAAALREINVKPVFIKIKRDLDQVSGLIIPGGESTTIGKLLTLYGLDEEIKKRADIKNKSNKKPLSVWGTCAGAILLAKKVVGRKPNILGLMDIEIERNAYGRQLDSFETKIYVSGIENETVPAVFIRAPKVKKASGKVKILAKHNNDPILLRQENLLISTFHPELTSDRRIHKYFMLITKEYAK